MAVLRAGVVQITSGPDLERNLRRAGELVREAAARGAKLIALPENFAFIGAEADKLALGETIDDPPRGRILATLAALARETGAYLLAGGMPERAAEPGRVHNTCVLLDAEGRVGAVYRKIHLFDVRLADGPTFTESATVAPGAEPVVADTPWGPLGLSVCYDLRFPELYRVLVGRGARLLAIPAAFTMYTGKDHWHVLLRARAVENLAYVLAPAQVGKHAEGRLSYGHSLIVDPWGAVLAEAPDRECVAVADLDLAAQDGLRRQLPALAHRRLG